MFSPIVGYLSSCFHFETKLSIFKNIPICCQKNFAIFLFLEKVEVLEEDTSDEARKRGRSALNAQENNAQRLNLWAGRKGQII